MGFNDLSGNKFGNLLIIKRFYREGVPQVLWECLCDCGEVAVVYGSELFDRKGKKGRRCCGRYCPYRRHINEKNMALIGERFGNLTVTNREDDKVCTLQSGLVVRRKVWTCQCDCGRVRKFNQSDIMRILAKGIVGCDRDCPKRLLFKQGLKSNGFSVLFKEYKKNANTRGYSWNLEEQEFREITQGNCFYCGAVPFRKKREYVFNGIDRKNNSIGYTCENCVSCCWRCNRMKGDLNVDDFMSSVTSVYLYLASKLE